VFRPARRCGTITPRGQREEAAPISVIKHSRQIQADSERILRGFAETRLRVLNDRRRALERVTAAVDAAEVPDALMLERLERLSLIVGRSPEIEEAKALLAEHYVISRGEAFELLTAISSHSNRKLRVVAEHLVADQRRPEKAASSPR
jgi:hypothetical protein